MALLLHPGLRDNLRDHYLVGPPDLSIMQYFIKVIVSAILIVVISEISKRSSLWGAVVASLPVVSIIAFMFLYQETKDVNKVMDLSKDIFWLVIPSLALFISLPLLLKKGIDFYPALGTSCVITLGCYLLMNQVMKYFGAIG
jgi:F0F1-type ATP synthase assembly protein I